MTTIEIDRENPGAIKVNGRELYWAYGRDGGPYVVGSSFYLPVRMMLAFLEEADRG